MSQNKFTLIADSTQLSSFSDCPEQWNLAHQERLEKIDQNKKAMNMGSYGHTLLERYYKARAKGENQQQGLEYSLIAKPDEYLQLTIEETQLLRDKITMYAYTYSNNDFIPQNPESVELGFSRPVFEDDSRLYILEGKLDKYQHTPSLGTYNGMVSIMDHKFQMRRHDLYEKRLQFRNYAWATNSNLFVINYIRMTKKNDEGTFQRKTVPFSSLELQLWHKRLIELFRKMEVAIRLANGEYGKKEGFEHRWGSCENKYGYACQFSDICEQTDQFSLNMVKETKYHVIKPWAPW